MYVTNIEEMQMRDDQVSRDKKERAARRKGSDDDDSEDESDEEEQSHEIDPAMLAALTLERETRQRNRELLKEEEEEEDGGPRGLISGFETGNLNAVNKHTKQIKVKNMVELGVDEATPMNRKEREILDAERKKEEYMRLSLLGLTDQAKQDKARLEMIKKKREADRIKREQEGRRPGMTKTGIDEEAEGSDSGSDDGEDLNAHVSVFKAPGAAAAAASHPPITDSAADIAAKKRANALAEVVEAAPGEVDIPKLSNMEIKKMNGDALKDSLRERGLSTQGQKKDLTKRLLDFEAARE